MASSFHVGQVVVCIDGSGLPPLDEGVKQLPREGGVYTIRRIRVDGPDVALILHEIVNPRCEWIDGKIGELAFLSWRFRPSQQTSLEAFEGLLLEMA